MVKASEKWARPRFFGGKGGLSGLAYVSGGESGEKCAVDNLKWTPLSSGSYKPQLFFI
jgi:hypothetical protein